MNQQNRMSQREIIHEKTLYTLIPLFNKKEHRCACNMSKIRAR